MKTLWWKEWRSQRGLAVGILAIGALGCWAAMQFAELTAVAVNCLLVAPVGALAFGAASIADERETGTLGLLRRLPVHPLRIWLTKAVFGTVLGLVLLAALWLVAWLTGAVKGHPVGLYVLAVATLCPLAWAAGAVWSSVSKQTVTAAVAGAGVLVGIELILGQALASRHSFGMNQMFLGGWGSAGARLMLALVLGAMGYWLFAGPSWQPPASWRHVAGQQWRRGRWVLAIFLGLGIVGGVATWLTSTPADGWRAATVLALLGAGTLLATAHAGRRVADEDDLLLGRGMSVESLWVRRTIVSAVLAGALVVVLCLLPLGLRHLKAYLTVARLRPWSGIGWTFGPVALAAGLHLGGLLRKPRRILALLVPAWLLLIALAWPRGVVTGTREDVTAMAMLLMASGIGGFLCYRAVVRGRMKVSYAVGVALPMAAGAWFVITHALGVYWTAGCLLVLPAMAAWLVPASRGWREGPQTTYRDWLKWLGLTTAVVAIVVGIALCVAWWRQPSAPTPVPPSRDVVSRASVWLDWHVYRALPAMIWPTALAVFAAVVLLSSAFRSRWVTWAFGLPVGLLLLALLMASWSLYVVPAVVFAVVPIWLLLAACIHAWPARRRAGRVLVVATWYLLGIACLTGVGWWWEVGRFPQTPCPFTPDELRPALLADQENSLSTYRRTMAALEQANRRDPEAKKAVEDWCYKWDWADDPTPPPFKMPSTYDECLALWAKATALPKVRWPMTDEPLWAEMGFEGVVAYDGREHPHSLLRQFTHLAEADVLAAYRSGEHARALKRSVQLLRFGVHLKQGPLVLHLLGVSAEAIALYRFPLYAVAGCRDERAWQELLLQFREAASRRPTLRQVWATMYAEHWAIWTSPERQVEGLEARARSLLSGDEETRIFDTKTRRERIVAKPWLLRLDLLRRQVARGCLPLVKPLEVQKARRLLNTRFGQLLKLGPMPCHEWATVPDVPEDLWRSSLLLHSNQWGRHMAMAHVRTRGRLDATICVLAVCAFRTVHGRLPRRLDEVVPRFLPALPTDSFDPRRTVAFNADTPLGPVVYLVGPDGKDDRGLVPWPYGGEGDWIFPIPAVGETWQQFDKRRQSWFYRTATQPHSRPTDGN